MKRTVTIGIPVYNEQSTITPVLEQLIVQEQENYILEKIIVVSDGSTDQTPQVVEQFIAAHPQSRVELLRDTKNRGRSTRLKQLYDLNKSDILIIFDGDLHLPDTALIHKFVSGFTTPKVGIVSSNNQPIMPSNLLGKVWWAGENLWYEVRRDYKNGVNLYNNSGCGIALEKNFAKNIHLPPETIADHQFIYLSSIAQKKDFVFQSDAIVYYHPPSTWKDILNQYRRALSEEAFFAKHWDNSMRIHFEMSPAQKKHGLLRALRQYPFLTLLSILLTKSLEKLPLQPDPQARLGLWQRTESTK